MSAPPRNAAARYFPLAALVAIRYALSVAVPGAMGGDMFDNSVVTIAWLYLIVAWHASIPLVWLVNFLRYWEFVKVCCFMEQNLVLSS